MGLDKSQRKRRNYMRDYSSGDTYGSTKKEKSHTSGCDGKGISNQTNQGSEETVDEGT